MLAREPEKTLKIIFLAVVVADVVLILLLSAAGASPIVIPLLVGITMADFLILAFIVTRRQRPVTSGDIMRVIRRLENEGPDALLAERQTHDAAPRSVQDALTLSALYCYKGDGANAENYARQAIRLLEETDTPALTDRESRVMVEMAQIALYDARVTQGQFAEAAAGLRQYIDVSPVPNMVTALVIWALYLAEQHDNARVMLSHLRLAEKKLSPKPYAPLPDANLRISPKYALIVAYMRHKLLGVVNADDLLAHRDAFSKWQEELARNAHNPYGARLREIVADLDAVLV